MVSMPVWALGSFLPASRRRPGMPLLVEGFQCPCGLWGLFYPSILMVFARFLLLLAVPGRSTCPRTAFLLISVRFCWLCRPASIATPSKTRPMLAKQPPKRPRNSPFWPVFGPNLRASPQVALPPSMLATRKRIDIWLLTCTFSIPKIGVKVNTFLHPPPHPVL